MASLVPPRYRAGGDDWEWEDYEVHTGDGRRVQRNRSRRDPHRGYDRHRDQIVSDAERAYVRGEIEDYYIEGDVLHYKDRYGVNKPYPLPSTYSKTTYTYTTAATTNTTTVKAPAPKKQSPLEWLNAEVDKVCALARVVS